MANTLQTLRRKVVQTPGANEAIDTVAEQLRMQIRALEAELRRLIGQHPSMSSVVSLLLGVPGVGHLLSAQLLVLTSGFTEIPSYRKLAQRLGVAPNPHQSGTSVYRPARSRGYGPPEARNCSTLRYAPRASTIRTGEHTTSGRWPPGRRAGWC
ncbi:hypothetical protein BH23BAC4_BH23BAC4_14770 [soil metagenome]